jgi:hypothetical protein
VLRLSSIYLILSFITLLAEEGSHWAFIKPNRHKLPTVKQTVWPINPIDYFILSKLEDANLKPSPVADRITLLRRVHLDLIGLPPTPAEVKSFLNEKSPDAYKKIVNKLLASPHYGERWGRHWLDAARYADSDGYSHDAPRVMWQYRDWVIGAINSDMPFTQFVIEQLAGDMLPSATMAQRIATGFHRNTQINTEGGVDKEQFRVDSIFDRIATTGEVMFGLTFGCIQCHDHKFDPFPHVEYYQMFAFFNQSDEPRVEAPTQEENKRRDEHNEKVVDLNARVKASKAKTPERKKLETELAKLKKSRPRATTALVMQQRKSPRVTKRFIQGDFTRPSEVVQAGTPSVLHVFPKNEDPNRLDFARWIASPNNPLLARVTVNRMWQRYFGKGIVETENDFGTQGTLPSHPELLDWLATEFVKVGWSPKSMHRLIVTSATYTQSSNARPDAKEVDPLNILLARQERLRLDAEIIRDAALASSGLLSQKMGGPGVYPPQPPGCMNLGQQRKTWKASSGEDRYRRAVYTYRWRATPHPALKVFDTPDAFSCSTKRLRSNTPLQALTLLNDPAFMEISKGLARRIIENKSGDKERVIYAFQLCLSRDPDKREVFILEDFLRRQQSSFETAPNETKTLLRGQDPLPNIKANQHAALIMLARVLLNTDEAITRE